MLAVDTETTGLNPWSCDLLCVSTWSGDSGKVWKPGDRRLARLLRSNEAKVFWDAPYDIPVLKRHGFTVRGKIHDGLLLARIADPLRSSYKLKNWARRVLGEDLASKKKLKSALRKAKKEWDKVPWEILEAYALDDARFTHDLYHVIAGQLDEEGKAVARREHRILELVLSMEETGIYVDSTMLAWLLRKVKESQLEAEERLRLQAWEGFRPTALRDLRKLFFEKLGFHPTSFTEKKMEPSMDRLTLQRIDHPAARDLLYWRKLQKAQRTYLQNIWDLRDKNSVIHPHFNQAGALTGRFSSSRPNFQNIPRSNKDKTDILGQVRGVFQARENFKFLWVDYAQIELRLAAHFARERAMIDAIHAGEDLHGVTAQRIFGVAPDHPDFRERRQIAKTLNFAILYGAAAHQIMDTLAFQSGIRLSLVETAQIVKRYKEESYPGIARLFEKMERLAIEEGGFHNPFSRWIPLSRDNSYRGVNYLIQGTAADLLKDRMLACVTLLEGRRSRLIATIHDELVFEIHKKEGLLVPQILDVMEDHENFLVPLVCSAASGFRWNGKRDISPKRMARLRRSVA